MGLFISLWIVGLGAAQPALANGLTISQAMPLGHGQDLVMVFFVTAMLFLLLWAILNYIQDRQPEVGLFAIHQAVYTLYGAAASGSLSALVPAGRPRLADGATGVLYFAINFTTLLFCRELFKLYEPPRFLMRGVNVLLGAFPLLVLALALGFGGIAHNTNAVLIEITWLYLALAAILFREEETPRRWILQTFFVAVCLIHVAVWLGERGGRFGTAADLAQIRLLMVDGLAVSGFFVVTLKARAHHAQLRAQQSFLDLLRVQKRFEVERELKKQAEYQAQTDYLTGIFNRRCFVETAERELTHAIAAQRQLSLLMFDIDHFKSINDRWGHATGDVVLQEVSRVIRDALRNGDIFGRTGGEEFAVVIVGTEGGYASSVAQRLCTAVADAVIAPADAGRIPVTISIGLAQLKGRKITFAELMNEADRAMYAAKRAGRNRVSAAA